MTVGASETRTFVVTEQVPRGALDFGSVVASCEFAPLAHNTSDGAYTEDSARVPGGFDGPWKFEEDRGFVQVVVGSGDALAKTGASVLSLGLLGAFLVAFGFGASIVGRRRTA